MKTFAILAAAVALAAPAAFAQSAVVVEGGPVLLEGAATSKPIRGAVIAEVPVAPRTVAISTSTTVLGAGPAVVTAAPAVVTPGAAVVMHYWNTPADISTRMDFKRWHRLL